LTQPEDARRTPGRLWPLLIVLLLVSCGPRTEGEGDSAPSPEAATATTVDEAAIAGLLEDSWMRSAAQHPDVVARLLDSPGGAGWLHLFHGELDEAARAFDAGLESGRIEPRLGRARVALERAAVFLEAEALQQRASADLARYRRDNPSLVRLGKLELTLRAMTLAAGGTPEEATLAKKAATTGTSNMEDPAVFLTLVMLEARNQGGDPRGFKAEGLPEPIESRAAFGQHLVGGRWPEPGDLQPGVPDIVDDLGEDPETGLRFQAPWFDPLVLRTLARHELLTARKLASGLGPAGDLVEAALILGWGAPLPAHPRPAIEPAADLPAWTALFASTAIDAVDWQARWTRLGTGDPAELALLSRLDSAWPDGEVLVGTDTKAVDRLLRQQEALTGAAAKALQAGVSEDGLSLVKDLALAQRFSDAVLRDRMDTLTHAGEAAQARRLGERSLDPNPGARGEQAGFTRVSYRNDRAFLLRYAHCLHAGGRPGLAREYVHPLGEEMPELVGIVWDLGQLDAASGIGVRGKISQQ